MLLLLLFMHLFSLQLNTGSVLLLSVCYLRLCESPQHTGMSRQTEALMGLGSLGIVGSDPDYITQLVGKVRRFAEVLLSLKEALSSAGEG